MVVVTVASPDALAARPAYLPPASRFLPLRFSRFPLAYSHYTRLESRMQAKPRLAKARSRLRACVPILGIDLVSLVTFVEKLYKVVRFVGEGSSSPSQRIKRGGVCRGGQSVGGDNDKDTARGLAWRLLYYTIASIAVPKNEAIQILGTSVLLWDSMLRDPSSKRLGMGIALSFLHSIEDATPVIKLAYLKEKKMKVIDAIKALLEKPMDSELILVVPATHELNPKEDGAKFYAIDEIGDGAEPSEETECILGGLLKG